MFERYTEKARRAIFFARYEAGQFGSASIESEHLLLGLLREDKELAQRLGFDGNVLQSVREQIERERPPREKVGTSLEIPLSQEGRRILPYAAEEAERMGHKHIGTDHLLLGILREEGCYAARLLKERGVKLDEAREKILQAAADEPEKATTRFYRSVPGRGPALPEAGRKAGEESSLLSEFLGDVGREAASGKFDPLIGREAELARVIEILCLRSRNHPVLAGEAGVGKSALVEGLAMRIATGDVPARLQEKRILTFDLGSLVAVLSATRRSEELVKEAMRELERMSGVIVYIEGLFAGGRTPGLPRIIKPLLDRDAIQCIAAALPAELSKWMDREPWLKEHFYAVEIPPPGEDDAIKILLTIKKRYEQFHAVEYSQEAIRHAVYYSEEFLPKGQLPDKAIDLIDEAGAAFAVRRSQLPEEVAEAQKRLRFVTERFENAIAGHEFEKAKYYSDEERKERGNLRALEEKYHLTPASTGMVGVAEIEEILSRWTNIPLETIRQGRRRE